MRVSGTRDSPAHDTLFARDAQMGIHDASLVHSGLVPARPECASESRWHTRGHQSPTPSHCASIASFKCDGFLARKTRVNLCLDHPQRP